MIRSRLVVAAILLATPAYAAPGGGPPQQHMLRVHSCNADSFYRELFTGLGMRSNAIAGLDCGFYAPKL